jgi:asparagine synthetase B (glutamine-hydrolysing)
MGQNLGRGLFPFRVDPAWPDALANSVQLIVSGARSERLQRSRRSSASHAERAGTDDPLALIQYLDLKTYLVGDINTKVDRASMAHSLEVREPLMDHELVEWMATAALIAKGAWPGGQVPPQRRRWSRSLPEDILFRPKMGFRRAARPLVPWPACRERVRQAVLGPRLAATGLVQSRITCAISSMPTSRERAITAAPLVDAGDV